MTAPLLWLADVLLGAGLKVAPTADWQSRGRGPMDTVRGVMCHHTGTRTAGNMPSLHLLIAGRSDLPGLLAQLGLGRDGTFYVIAAGRANHAGVGSWAGITTGNTSFIGIEAENDGTGEAWPAVQLDAYQRGVAAILRRLGAGADMCCGHKEYARPAGRKSDPILDMAAFRHEVAALLSGRTSPPLIAAIDAGARPTLRRGDKGDAVRRLQILLGVGTDGFFGAATEAALRAFQRRLELVPDGIAGPATWQALSTQTAPSAPVSKAAPPPASSRPIALPPAETAELKPRGEGRLAIGPGGERFAVQKPPGFYTRGETPLATWLAASPPGAAISPSLVRIVAAMSVVEGRLEAVNSYDDAYLSFGIFQWTAGEADAEGELASLLARFKAANAAGFAECFGQYGLDVTLAHAGATTGGLTLAGTKLTTAADKQTLRGIEWAYRFWRAGHHASMRSCQFELAASRVARFAELEIHGQPVRAWASSEFGVALMLDEHVNRSGNARPRDRRDWRRHPGPGRLVRRAGAPADRGLPRRTPQNEHDGFRQTRRHDRGRDPLRPAVGPPLVVRGRRLSLGSEGDLSPDARAPALREKIASACPNCQRNQAARGLVFSRSIPAEAMARTGDRLIRNIKRAARPSCFDQSRRSPCPSAA